MNSFRPKPIEGHKSSIKGEKTGALRGTKEEIEEHLGQNHSPKEMSHWESTTSRTTKQQRISVKGS